MVGVCRCVFECGVCCIIGGVTGWGNDNVLLLRVLKYSFVDGFSRTPGGTRNNEQNMMHSVAFLKTFLCNFPSPGKITSVHDRILRQS